MKNLVAVIKGDDAYLSKYFTAHELRCRSANAPVVYYLPLALLNIADYLRDITGAAMTCSSAGRTKEHNGRTAGSATNSQHIIDSELVARALDLHWLAKNDEHTVWLREQVEQKTYVFQEMRRLGLQGIGFYDWGVHIDVRTAIGGQRDSLGTYAKWNYQEALKKKESRMSAARKYSLI